jgi:hypothetical protein
LNTVHRRKKSPNNPHIIVSIRNSGETDLKDKENLLA